VMDGKPQIEVEYCATCGFLPRATWMAQEILASHKADVAGVNLLPSDGGIFVVRIDGAVVFSNKEQGRFPETREIRDAIRAALGMAPAPSHKKST
jgi:selenoprotein W-related protein